MRGVNKAIIVGNVGADPEVRYMPSGTAVVNLSLATNETWKDKQTGEPQERTEWHRVVLFGRLAEIAGEYVKKGRTLYIEGRLQTRKWQSQDGQDRYTTEIVANEMQLLGGPGGGGGGGGGAYNQDPGWGAGAPAGGQPQQRPQQQPSAPAPSRDDDFDDDIPF